MSVLILLIFASLVIAAAFLIGFIWAVRSGQYEDTSTPPLRMLVEEPGGANTASPRAAAPPPQTKLVQRQPTAVQSPGAGGT